MMTSCARMLTPGANQRDARIRGGLPGYCQVGLLHLDFLALHIYDAAHLEHDHPRALGLESFQKLEPPSTLYKLPEARAPTIGYGGMVILEDQYVSSAPLATATATAWRPAVRIVNDTGFPYTGH